MINRTLSTVEVEGDWYTEKETHWTQGHAVSFDSEYVESLFLLSIIDPSGCFKHETYMHTVELNGSEQWLKSQFSLN